MRLVCPNCAAQYEVDDSAIPDEGRDVQCANCGKTWFQGHAHGTPPEPGASEGGSTQSEIPEIADSDAGSVDEPDADEPAGHSPPARAARPAAGATDPTVLDILRREAERETSARNGDTDPEHPAEDHDEPTEEEETPEGDAPSGEDQETVADLAFRARRNRSELRAQRQDSADRKNRISRAQAGNPDEDEPVYGDDDAPETVEEPAAPPEPELPDVAALKSSLRAAEDKARAAAPQAEAATGPKPGQRGGRFGFYLAILIALLLAAIYVLSAQIADAVPAAAPYVEGYVSAVNVARTGLDDGIRVVVAAARNLLAQYL